MHVLRVCELTRLTRFQRPSRPPSVVVLPMFSSRNPISSTAFVFETCNGTLFSSALKSHSPDKFLSTHAHTRTCYIMEPGHRKRLRSTTRASCHDYSHLHRHALSTRSVSCYYTRSKKYLFFFFFDPTLEITLITGNNLRS